MKILLQVLVGLSFLCATKRGRTNASYRNGDKRLKTGPGSFIQTLWDDDVESFDATFEEEKAQLEECKVFGEHLEKMICLNNSFLLRKMLMNPEFRATVSSTTFFIASSGPDVFYALATAPSEPEEPNLMKDETQFNQVVTVIRAMNPSLAEMARKFCNFTKTRNFIKSSFTESYDPKAIAFMRSLYAYLPENVIGCLSNGSNKPDHVIALLKTIEAVYEAIKTSNYKGIEAAFKPGGVYGEEGLVKAILHASLELNEDGIIKAIENLNHQSTSDWNGDSIRLLCLALSRNKFNHIKDILIKISPYTSQNFYSFDRIMKALVAKEDLDTVSRLRKDLVIPEYKFSPNELCVIRLAEEARAGNWRYILVFMQMNPNKLILIDSAWNMILSPNEDLFVKFITMLKENSPSIE